MDVTTAAGERGLEPGDELRCPHCGRWHPVTDWHSEGDYTKRMLYWRCRDRMFYAGQAGGESRHQTRRA